MTNASRGAVRVEIVDPQGFHHVLVAEQGRWHESGWWNIAHGFDPGMRGRVIEAVLRAVTLKQPLPHGFKYAQTHN